MHATCPAHLIPLDLIFYYDSEIIAQLNGKFKTSTKESEQVQILMILPHSCTVRKI
jgi:hypothetical protein